MKKNVFVKAEIIKVRFKSVSCYGNPKYEVIYKLASCGNKLGFSVYSAETANNSSAGYAIQNYDFGQLCYLTLHYTKKGNCIIDYVESCSKYEVL